MLKNRWLGLLLALLLAVTTACSGSDDEQDESGSEGESSSESVDVPDVPDVVAEVNGEEISKDAFTDAYEARARQAEAAAQQGQGAEQPDPEQLTDEVVQSLVNEELLKQEADRRDIDASEKQVKATLDELATQSGMQSSDELVKALEDQGLSREDIDRQALQQTRFDMLVDEEAGSVTATDKEVRDLYQQAKQQQEAAGQGGQQLPPLKQVRPQLVQQVEQQKTSEAGRKLIDGLREQADITVNV